MARDLEHFEIPRWQEPIPRRKHGGGGKGRRREDRKAHGEALDKEIDAVERALQKRAALRAQGINPKLVFRLRLKKEYGDLDDDEIAKLGLVILGRNPDGVLAVFPDKASVEELRRRVREYAGLIPDGHKYGELEAIDEIRELTRDDRLGPRLRESPFREDEVAALDIELWHSGNPVECRAWIAEIGRILQPFDSRITDDYVGASLCVARARLNRQSFDALLDPALDYIKQIDRRSTPTFELGQIARLDAADLETMIAPVQPGLVGVIVVDSGVATAHPLLESTIGDSQSFLHPPEDQRAGDGDEITGGHGTAVAGLAAYGDIAGSLRAGMFEPSALVFSARVTDRNNEYDAELLPEHQLERAVSYFLDNYPQARVVNISLGDNARVYRETDYQFRLAAAIDELAYRYRDREVLFVISAGNSDLSARDGDDVLHDYPLYLLAATNRLIDPATSAIALTVGGLSYGEGQQPVGREREWTDRLVAGQQGWPSPFTRTGPGVGGAVKPEIVDYAGDLRVQRGRIGDTPQHAGLPTTNRSFAPPEGRLLRTVAGTSFAAPRVANLAARLFREFPGASSNLVRALIAASSQIPKSRPGSLAELRECDDDLLHIYGYGQPDFERARWSAENDVVLLTDGVVDVDSFSLFEIPAPPSSFFTQRGVGHLSVCLAFDPPTRHTRADSYLGVTMEAHLFRNRDLEALRDVLRAYTREEKEIIANQRQIRLDAVKLPSRQSLDEASELPGDVDLQPGINVRKKGTLQRGMCRITSRAWRHDGRPFALAVICRRMWAPEEISQQRFAVVVTLSHDDEKVRIHEHLRAKLQLTNRVRVRL